MRTGYLGAHGNLPRYLDYVMNNDTHIRERRGKHRYDWLEPFRPWLLAGR